MSTSALDRIGRLAPLSLSAGLGLVLMLWLWSEARSVRYDLHVVMPTQARPGGTLPVRAYIFDLNEADPTQLAKATLRARLLEVGADAELARAELTPAPRRTYEGALALPRGPRRVRLRVMAERDGHVIASITRTVELTEQPPTTSWSPLPFDSFLTSPAQPLAGQLQAGEHQMRVRGGSCVLGQRCTLAFRTDSGVTIEAGNATSAVAALHSSSFARAQVDVTGAGADVQLHAAGGAGRSETTRWALPIATGIIMPQAGMAIVDDSTPTEVVLHELPAGGVFYDGFRDGFWELAGSVQVQRGAASPKSVSFQLELAPGLWRLQLRGDPFDVGSAGARYIYVRAKDEPVERVAEALRRAVLAAPLPSSGQSVERAGLVAPPPSSADELEFWAAHTLALLEGFRAPLPRAVRSEPTDRAALVALQRRLRTVALSAATIAGCVALLVFLFGGLRAGRQAEVVMERATARPISTTQKIIGRLRIIAAAAVVSLAFFAVIAAIVGRV